MPVVPTLAVPATVWQLIAYDFSAFMVTGLITATDGTVTIRHGKEEPANFRIPERLFQPSCTHKRYMTENIVRRCRRNERRIRVDRSMRGRESERRIVRHENDVISRIVAKLVRTATVMRSRAIARRYGRAHRSEDLQVVGRIRIDVRHLHCAVAIPRPEFPVRRYHYAVGTGAVCGRGTAAARQRASHAGNAGQEYVALGIDDVHAEVRSVCEVIPLCSRIDPGNVSAGDGIAWNRDDADESDGRLCIVLVVIAVLAVAIIVIFLSARVDAGSQSEAQT